MVKLLLWFLLQFVQRSLERYISNFLQSFTPGPPSPDILNAYKNDSRPCHGFPGPGNSLEGSSVYTFNPMKEFMDSDSDHVNTAFDDFAGRHDKKYPSSDEAESRKDIFRQNMRYIYSTNR